MELIQKFPLRSIRTEDELDAATEVLHRLLDGDLDAGGQVYLDALTDLIETYEDTAHPIPDASEADVLRHLMDANTLTQTSLHKLTGIAISTISAVLGQTRHLTRDQIATLAKTFHVSPAVFYPNTTG